MTVFVSPFLPVLKLGTIVPSAEVVMLPDMTARYVVNVVNALDDISDKAVPPLAVIWPWVSEAVPSELEKGALAIAENTDIEPKVRDTTRPCDTLTLNAKRYWNSYFAPEIRSNDKSVKVVNTAVDVDDVTFDATKAVSDEI